ncbi:MAG: AAA family ATPase [Proteobacteria bacterium]|nr:AAA family ATPase [Pseudomonadota bacterium]
MEHLTISSKLYGRDRDINRLLESFERVSSGHGEVLLVPGPSGVGKTALVHELRMPVLKRNGIFIQGKVDQYQHNVPYFAFRQALTELCCELLSGKYRSHFKVDILSAIGNLGQVLIDTVPEFETLLGVQPPLENISPQEARYRFAGVFRNLLKVICKPERPVTLFIDDWQWAGTSSFELLKQMEIGSTLRYLLVIVSYRDNEVKPGHPLLSMIDDLRSHAVPVELLQVKNIALDDVREIVTDTLIPVVEESAGLALMIYEKTRGNPFFVRSLINFLHEFKLIWFDQDRNCWQWRNGIIDGATLPDTVLELFALKLGILDTDSRNLFSLAACLGNSFDLDILSMISGRTLEECLTLLFSQQATGLLLPYDGGSSIASAGAPASPRTGTFLHDRVQQAAYGLLAPAELPAIRLKIGRLLLASLGVEQLDKRLFEVVNNLNAGYPLIQEPAEQLKVLQLNIIAARKAYAAVAFSAALQFYRAANRFLENPVFADHLWRDHHDSAMELFKGRAECEFLEGSKDEAEECIQQAVAHAESALEQAGALTLRIVQYTLLARYGEAIAAGRLALEALGISLPVDGYEEARNAEIALVRQALESRTISSLVGLPPMSDPEMLMASKILITLGPPCYRSHQRLWAVLVPKVVNLTLRYGNIDEVGYSHTAFGGLLGWVDDDYVAAREFGELATRLMTTMFRSPSDQSVFYLMIGSSIRHWFKHLKYSTQDYKDAYEIGLLSGNLQYAAYAFGHNMYCRFYQGVSLADLIRETKRSLEFSRTRHNQWAIDLLEAGLQVFGVLSAERPAVNTNDAWSEETFLQQVKDHQNIQVTCIYKVLKTFSLLVSGDYEGALVVSDESEPLMYTVGTQGLLPWPEHVFARLLILTALYTKADGNRQTTWRTELEGAIARLRIWADNCPENYGHKYLLAAAELARIDGRPVDAMQLYDNAVEAAQKGGFLQWEGMANERAYNFWLGFGSERMAQNYWQQAYVCYSRWGGVAKVHSMETAYRENLVETFHDGNGAERDGEIPEYESKNLLVERQITHLRRYATQMQQTSLRVESARQADELADALQRLRVEIAERKQAEQELRRFSSELEKNNKALQDALAEVKQLTGLLPICAWCKQIRDDRGYWHGVEMYIAEHSSAEFSHGICPECEKKEYEKLDNL